ncbi:ATP-binding protein [Actinomadura fibrosa]|uniref:ATP-binding protein n=1 Tax=Actinomadura fibrosa TaxID=111802 RepID=A0ABW2XT70_9ACTN|nr:ATP-binding protein [Actinomadura fibrosa]
MEPSTGAAELVRELREVELFAHLPAGQLDWIAEVAEVRELADGTVLIEDGAVTTHLYVLLAGELAVTKRIDGHEVVFTRHTVPAPAEPEGGKPAAAHQFTGELQLLTDGVNIAAVTVVGGARVLALGRDAFFELVARCPSVARVMLPVMAWRIRESEVRARSQVTAAALSDLAAGIAHELNNPTAVVARIAAELGHRLDRLTRTAYRWAESTGPAERAALDGLLADLELAAAPDTAPDTAPAAAFDTAPAAASGGAFGGAPGADPLETAELADELLDWMSGQGAPAAVALSTALAERGVRPDRLADGLGRVGGAAALDHLCVLLDVRELVAELRAAAPRISALVGQVRSYTHLDRAPEQDLDVTEGIEAALAMLRPRLAGIGVDRRYATGVPRVWGYPSELNQVWSELIGAAADAAGPAGTLTLEVGREDGRVAVEIRGTGGAGPGDPPRAARRAPEPYFTTRQIGDGSGFGLQLAHQIVTRRHGGTVSIASAPDGLRASIRLPALRHPPRSVPDAPGPSTASSEARSQGE